MSTPSDDSKTEEPEKKTSSIIMNVSDTQYEIVKYVGTVIMEWQLSFDSEFNDWDVNWVDLGISPEQLGKMKQHQKINHFPGMYCLSRKNQLAKNLTKMRKKFPKEYNFFPKTWSLPTEIKELKYYAQAKKKHRFYIVKPEASCQGKGIYLTRNINAITLVERSVVQKYTANPFLIDDLKCDFRIYVLLAGCDPLRIYIYTEGLVRFATENYVAPTAQNIQNFYMHLTNYAINKDSENFVFNEDDQQTNVGHKRTLSSVFESLKEQGHDIDTLWMEMKDIIIKTIISGQPTLKHMYQSSQPQNLENNMCFQILGFDILVTDKCKWIKPILLEVNHSPSFHTDSPLDTYVKQNLVQDTLQLVNVNDEKKSEYKSQQKQDLYRRAMSRKQPRMSQEERKTKINEYQQQRDIYENENMGGYEKIYPVEDEEDETNYDKYLQYAQQMMLDQFGTGTRKIQIRQDKPKVNNFTTNQNVDQIQKIYQGSGKKPSTAQSRNRDQKKIVRKEDDPLTKSGISQQKQQTQTDQMKVNSYTMENLMKIQKIYGSEQIKGSPIKSVRHQEKDISNSFYLRQSKLVDDQTKQMNTSYNTRNKNYSFDTRSGQENKYGSNIRKRGLYNENG